MIGTSSGVLAVSGNYAFCQIRLRGDQARGGTITTGRVTKERDVLFPARERIDREHAEARAELPALADSFGRAEAAYVEALTAAREAYEARARAAGTLNDMAHRANLGDIAPRKEFGK
jgi:hypothetical protein